MDTPTVVVVNHYKRPVIKDVKVIQDPILTCWQYIFENWHTTTWQPIPIWIRQQIKFHPQLGMCNGNLITQNGAKGMNEFLLRMNRKEN